MDDKKRFDRILGIYFVLQSKAQVSASELTERFDVSQRTIYRDIRALNEAGVPVVSNQGQGYSILEGFRIKPPDFSREEVLSLMIAEKMMSKHETLFVKRQFESAVAKIKSSFRMHQKDELLELEDRLNINSGSDAGTYLPNVIDLLLNSILFQKIVFVRYLKVSDDQADYRRLEPVGLYYENEFWYVLAYCHLRADYRNFRLDRIRDIGLTDEVFSREHPPYTKLRKQLVPAIRHRVVVKVKKDQAHLLFWERDVFGFCAEELFEDYSVMHFDCRHPAPAFARWLMRYADVAKVLSPESMREEIAGLVAEAIKTQAE